MKKLLTVLLLSALVLTCLLGVFAACKPQDNDPDDPDKKPSGTVHNVSIVCPTLETEVGSQPDFKSKVTVTVDGNKVDDPEITATLVSGDVTKAGRCVYNLSFSYDGETYTKPAYVNFVDKSQVKPDPKPVDEESKKFNEILAKQYESFTFTYKYEVPADGSVVNETEKYDKGKYFIDYDQHIVEKTFVEDSSLPEGGKFETTVSDDEGEYYLQTTETSFVLYFNSESKWYYRTLNAASETDYAFWPLAFFVAEYDTWDYSMFSKSAENTYSVLPVWLDLMASEMMGDDDSRAVNSITLKTDGSNVTEVKIEYSATDNFNEDYDAVVTYRWSDFETVSVTLPEAEKYIVKAEKPDYIEPTANTLTEEEAQALNEALAKEYTKLNFGFDIDKGDYYTSTLLRGALDGDKGYCYFKSFATIYEQETVFDLYDYYYKAAGADKVEIFNMIEGDYVRALANGTFAALLAEDYYPVKSVGLTGEMFGKVGDVYVVRSDKLNQAYALLDAAFGFSGDKELTNISPCTCQIKLDANNNVTELYIVLHAYSNVTEVYAQYTFTYGDFNSATLNMPNETQLSELTSDRQTELTNAIKAENFENVTMYEIISENVYKIIGNDIYATLYEGRTSQNVHYRYDETNAKWLKVLGQETQDADMEEFVLSIIRYNFAALSSSLSNFKYDEVHGVYYLENVTQELISEFAPYYDNFKELYDSQLGEGQEEFGGFKAITVKVEEGKVTRITLMADELSVSVTFSDYGSTQPNED